MWKEDIISFRKDYHTSQFPVEAVFYEYLDDCCLYTSRLMHSAQEFAAFQEELSRREASGEWLFVAYSEPLPI